MSSTKVPNSESTPGGQGPAEQEGPDGEAATPSGDIIETTECPHRGRAFVGDYCPASGQEADPSTSIVEVLGGFFRELVDVESGFWPTFVRLAVRPGRVLRAYLGGVRKRLTNPGRYLLAAVVVDVAVDRLLAWVGAKGLSWTNPGPTSSADGGGETEEGFWAAVEVASEQVGFVFEGPEVRVIGVLLVAALFAVLLYRLLGDELERMGEGVAVACFTIAHATFLSRGADLLYVGAASLYIGQFVGTSSLLNGVVYVGYAGFAAYSGFGPGWKSALKGAFGIIWAYAGAYSVTMIVTTLYAVWLLLIYPNEYVPAGGLSETELVAAPFVGLVGAIPLLLHAGVEVYARYR
jgi:hypothetical protein